MSVQCSSLAESKLWVSYKATTTPKSAMATPPNAVAMAAAPPVEVELGAGAPPSSPDVVAAGPSVELAPLGAVVSPDSPEVLAAVVVSTVVVPAPVVGAEVVLGAAVDSELSEPLSVEEAEPDSVAK